MGNATNFGDLEQEPLDADKLKAIVERHFRVYDHRKETFRGGESAHMFFLMFSASEFDDRYAAMSEELRAWRSDLLFFLRHEGGEDVLLVTLRQPQRLASVRVNAVLLVATILTTVTAGALVWANYSSPTNSLGWKALWDPSSLLWGGLTFALPLMAILGIHETGHYLVARRHGLRASLPFFIPVPPVLFPIGTLGAFISLRDPIPDRKVLFDVGASGPLAGFIVAVPVVILGAALTGSYAIEVPELGAPEIDAGAYDIERQGYDTAILSFTGLPNDEVRVYTYSLTAPDQDDWQLQHKAAITLGDGETITQQTSSSLGAGEARGWTLEVPANATAAKVTLTWDDGLVEFGDPLLVMLLDPFFDNDDYLTHPTFFAGWVGLLVTGINLLPAGQLDGGHVARAVLGERMRLAAYVAMGMLLYLGLKFGSWLLMAAFILIMGLQHPPPLNDRTQLDGKRKFMAAVVWTVLILTFVPRPVIF